MLLDTILEDLKQSQLSRDELKVSTLRMLISELKYAEINTGKELEDPEVIIVIQKEIKKRKEAAESFKSGTRQDLADKEESEQKILEVYLPTQMSDSDLENIINQVIEEQDAKVISDMGKVMG